MMLDELVGAIETLKQRIRTHGATLRANEIRTRVALIDPLLVALGWDVSDPALVTPEYAVGEGRADYALHGSESIPAAMVEAKRLGHALSDDERMQMLNYANARGVRYAAVTDGDVWEFYEVFKQAPLEDRRLLSLRIANTPAHELALQLLLLWRPNLASGQPVKAERPVFGNGNGDPPPEPPPPTGWLALSGYNLPGGTPSPAAIRFPDGTERTMTQWHETLTHMVEWLFVNGRLNFDNTPVVNGPGHRYIISTGTVHPNGEAFAKPVRVNGTPFWVNINLNAAQVRRYASVLLEHCSVSPDTVQLQAGQQLPAHQPTGE